MSETTAHELDRPPFKMKDLCEQSGLPRQAIHFYIQQGLLPAGKKTGRNMAWYGPEHVERLRLIKKLQHERFLPLKAIKALLDGREESFSPRQQRFLGLVKGELDRGLLGDVDAKRETVDAVPLLQRYGVRRDELDQLIELGVIAASADADRVMIASDDEWILEFVGRMREAGFSDELGFTVEDLAGHAEAINEMLRRDAELVGQRLTELPPVQVARMLERALPLLEEFLVRYHRTRVKDFFSTM